MNKMIYNATQDPEYRDLYIDVREERNRSIADGTEIPYLYVHGGFSAKGVKFSWCIPKKAAFQGRFYQYMSPFPGPDEEMASLNKGGEDDEIAFCLKNGAGFVESNMGSSQAFGGQADPTILWKSSAAVAEAFRTFVMELYGCARPFGYVYGGSGGGYKTMACIENTNAWDGAVPFVIGSPVSLPNTITLHVQGQRVLRNVFGKIVDALDAGGSGDMYEGLNEDEAFILKEVTAMGFPPKAWFLEATGLILDGSLPVLYPPVKFADPGYFRDFWTEPGYLGSDPKGSAAKDRLVFTTRIKAVHFPGETVEAESECENGVDTAWKKQLTDGNGLWVELEEGVDTANRYTGGVEMAILTGNAAGKTMTIKEMRNDCAVIGMCFGVNDLSVLMKSVQPGDEVRLDNSDYIAMQSYYRHQVPSDPAFHAWDQFRNENGQPNLPQRPNILGYSLCGTGTVQEGTLQGKTIVIQSMMDESTCPWCADWYRKTIMKEQGHEDNFRLYYMDRCLHGNNSLLENNMITNYMGALHQTLLDLSDWVERGVEPLPSSVYTLQNGQIILSETAAERRGVQCVPTLLANGETCCHVKTGETVHFTARAVVPAGAGSITSMDYAVTADNTLSAIRKPIAPFPYKGAFTTDTENGLAVGELDFEHIYTEPGTYIASVRVAANRNGDAAEPFTQIKNIARVRVIVE